MFIDTIKSAQQILVRQRKELIELVGYETRNKYSIETSNGEQIGFAAEQQKSVLGFLLRQVVGHWRKFEIHVFDRDRKLQLVVRHPFRFFFQRLDIYSAEGAKLGAIQQRFSILSKKFDLEGPNGQVELSVNSSLFKLWTFPFTKNGREIAVVKKRWGGTVQEVFTDADTFLLEIHDTTLAINQRLTLLGAAIFIDLRYFEAKARK